MKQALIIFVRNPVAGKVKTRIAKTAGEEKALEIYIELLRHTKEVTENLEMNKHVFYSDAITKNDLWHGAYIKHMQIGDDLGERMKNAFALLFNKGYNAVCIIGSDCLDLSGETIAAAFDALQYNDVVIGPSEDGGYYLLALKLPQQNLFAGIQWSTGKVLKQTLEKCAENNLSYHLLQMLNDIDDEADWQQHLNKQQI